MIWTILIGITRIGTIWAAKAIVRKTFQTGTIIFVTALYIDINKRRAKRYSKKIFVPSKEMGDYRSSEINQEDEELSRQFKNHPLNQSK